MKLIQVDERMFAEIPGMDNHPCDWSIEEEDGTGVLIWTCPKCPQFIIKTYDDGRKGVYRGGTKDLETEKRVHHFGKCQPAFN